MHYADRPAISAFFLRNAAEGELDDELRFHFEREAEKHMTSGLPREEALRRARLAFAGLEQVKEECRQARGISALESVIQDLRYAIRGMRRSPAFTIAALLTQFWQPGQISPPVSMAKREAFYERMQADAEQYGIILGKANHP